MAKRRVRQINNLTIIYETRDAEYYVTDQSGNILETFYDQKPAEEFCRNCKDHTKVKSAKVWGVESMAAQSIEDAFVKAGVARANVSLPKDGSYTKDLNGIIKLFTDKLGKPEENARMRLEQYYRDYESRGLPAFERLQEAICITATKTKADQRTIAYMIGILKQWNDHGYGNTFNEEQRKVIHLFESKIDMPLSDKAKTEMLRLINTYGIVDIMTTMFTNEHEKIDVDLSLMYIQQLERKIDAGLIAE